MTPAPVRLLVPLALAALLSLGAASASSAIDAGVAYVQVQDSRGSECGSPVPDVCAASTHVDPASPGESTVDAYQRIDYVGVATNPDGAGIPVSSLGLPVPDESYTVHGSDLYVREPFVRFATERWQDVSSHLPGTPAYLHMGSDGVGLHYDGPSPWDPSTSGPQAVGFDYSHGQGVGYEQVGPVNAPTGTSTDEDATGWETEVCDPADATCHGVAQGFREASPNATWGLEIYDLQAASNRSALTGPVAPHLAAAPAAPAAPAPAPLVAAVPPSPGAIPPAVHARADAPAPFAARAPPAPRDEGAKVLARASAGVAPPSALRDLAVAVAGGAVLAAIFSSLYNRFTTRAEVLESDVRAKLLQLIGERPGICISDAVPSLGMTRNAVLHHVRMLARARVIVVVTEEGRKLLYLPGTQPQQSPLPPALLRHPVRGALLAALRESPGGMTRDQVHQLLSHVPERTRNYTIARLAERNIIQQRAGPAGEAMLVLNEAP